MIKVKVRFTYDLQNQKVQPVDLIALSLSIAHLMESELHLTVDSGEVDVIEKKEVKR